MALFAVGLYLLPSIRAFPWLSGMVIAPLEGINDKTL